MMNTLARLNCAKDALLFAHAIGRKQYLHRLADHLGRGIAVNALGATIPGLHQAGQILGNNSVVGGFDNCRQPGNLRLVNSAIGSHTANRDFSGKRKLKGGDGRQAAESATAAKPFTSQ